MKYTFIALLLFSASLSRSQSISPNILNAAGGSATITGNLYEYAIGEMGLVTTFNTGSIVLTQGLLQPVFQIPEGISTSQYSPSVNIYPNPTYDELHIVGVSQVDEEIDIVILDVLGRVLYNERIIAISRHFEKNLSLGNYASGHYQVNLKSTNANRFWQETYKVELMK